MSTAAAVEAVVPAKKGKKKLIIIIAAVAALVLAGGGGAAFFMLKKKSAAAHTAAADGDGEAQAEGEAESGSHAKAASKRDPKVLPIFVPLDPFTVNLADRDADRYAQVGITLEIDNPKTADRIKAFMPAIRNNILMAIADRTAVELLGRNGKKVLADKVRRETARAISVEDEGGGDEAAPDKASGKKGAASGEPEAELPVRAVHFSNFIVQ